LSATLSNRPEMVPVRLEALCSVIAYLGGMAITAERSAQEAKSPAWADFYRWRHEDAKKQAEAMEAALKEWIAPSSSVRQDIEAEQARVWPEMV
jgi:hypothetical protein